MHPANQVFRAHGGTFSRACRDLSVETPIGRWNMIEAQPAPDLADLVECYWEGWGDIPPLREKILPRTHVELMFNLRGRHRILELDGRDEDSAQNSGWLSGMQRRYMLIETFEGSHFVAARLKPWGAWRLLRESMASVAGAVPRIGEVWGTHSQSMQDRLLSAANPFARFDILEAELRRRIDRTADLDASLVEASCRLRGTQGRLRISTLCKDIGTSRATLSRKFRDQVGLTPKTYARVVRIDALMAHLASHGPDQWAMLAEDFGYHDQAHLNHDFREFCGATPQEYLRRAAPGGGATLEDPPAAPAP
ncbi:MAG: AraC family transcriptional regulator [Xanthomonadales bacterium]|nr:AraC family transcriptional regulator [Xanthomonadales bacterium]